MEALPSWGRYDQFLLTLEDTVSSLIIPCTLTHTNSLFQHSTHLDIYYIYSSIHLQFSHPLIHLSTHPFPIHYHPFIWIHHLLTHSSIHHYHLFIYLSIHSTSWSSVYPSIYPSIRSRWEKWLPKRNRSLSHLWLLSILPSVASDLAEIEREGVDQEMGSTTAFVISQVPNSLSTLAEKDIRNMNSEVRKSFVGEKEGRERERHVQG